MDLEKLRTGAAVFGSSLSDKQLESFNIFATQLRVGNERTNLLGQADDATLLSHHFLDSLSCLAPGLFLAGMSVMDLGSGAGLPGIPLAIARPDLNVILLDSSEKRTKFLREAVGFLELKNVEVVRARAEEAGRDPLWRDVLDIVTARAVAPLSTLVEYALPFLRVRGLFMAQRGPKAAQEAVDAAVAISELNGRLARVEQVKVPFLEAARFLVHIEKTGPTPERYPRRTGVPLKRPLY